MRYSSFMKRGLTLSLVLLSVLAITAHDAEAARRKKTRVPRRVSVSAGVNDARYADIILNPQTGEIYHQTDADGRRYPASLTKMMTLYLLFEALENHKITLGTQMEVSDYASGMPQTNLALAPGDSIPVETAIKALVVRSANDVAVVVGEHLGGDVDHFADMMTAKARALGMRNTVFQNPNGLPNNLQHTTARDMAKLGIALKRDFPRYYPYFAVRQFSWNGSTYYTHNRVMLRYPGTDGIKTGYIGLSGFNLVTSVTRGGRPLVGVVMGGSTGAWRDNRMIQLLDDSYKIVAARGAARGKTAPENLPITKNGARSGIGAQNDNGVDLKGAQLDAKTLDEDDIDRETEEDEETSNAAGAVSATPATPVAKKPVVTTPAVAAVPSPAPKPVATEQKQPIRSRVIYVSPPTAPAVVSPTPPAAPHVVATPIPPAPIRDGTADSPQKAPSTSPFVSVPTTPPEMMASPLSVKPGAGWGVQVGAFSSHELAERSAKQAMERAKPALTGASIQVVGPENNGAPVHRARLTNLSETQAKAACERLIANNTPCFIFKSTN